MKNKFLKMLYIIINIKVNVMVKFKIKYCFNVYMIEFDKK